MKKIILFILLVGFYLPIHSQSYQVDLQVASFSEMDFAPFIFSNDLSGAPRIFSISILPEQGNVKIRGELFWKQNPNSSYEWLLTFRTRVFPARSFFNTDLGTSIPLGRGQSDGDLIEENRKRNKPTGEYRLDIYLLDENDNQLATDTEYYEFSNPAQTLSLNSPLPGATENIGGVLAQWTELEGVQYYQVLANVRSENTQSLEEALTSGDPLINNVQVGLVTSIDLRTILTREWLPGQEIVVQVSALPVGGSNADIIRSNIVNFFLDDPSNPFKNQASNNFRQMLQTITDGLGSDLLNRLLSGDVLISEISWEDTGLPMTQEEIQALLDYLRQHPENLINIEQD
ncbi:MAG: hypothetical protein QY331_04705 [Melioribacteraceae bacterium]|nr:hypothetical protein [Melioribacteraceae bacterium]WKZ70553.1 MAG: hypothetical protein QY331_04705 [Melioribacteraceae bacterium]